MKLGKIQWLLYGCEALFTKHQLVIWALRSVLQSHDCIPSTLNCQAVSLTPQERFLRYLFPAVSLFFTFSQCYPLPTTVHKNVLATVCQSLWHTPVIRKLGQVHIYFKVALGYTDSVKFRVHNYDKSTLALVKSRHYSRNKEEPTCSLTSLCKMF